MSQNTPDDWLSSTEAFTGKRLLELSVQDLIFGDVTRVR